MRRECPVTKDEAVALSEAGAEVVAYWQLDRGPSLRVSFTERIRKAYPHWRHLNMKHYALVDDNVS